MLHYTLSLSPSSSITQPRLLVRLCARFDDLLHLLRGIDVAVPVILRVHENAVDGDL